MAGNVGRRRQVRVEIVAAADIVPLGNMIQWVSFRDLSITALVDLDSCMQWLAVHGLLRNTRTCEQCRGYNPCRLQRRRARIDGYMWRCPNCMSDVSIRKDSFFSRSHLPLLKILELIYHWSEDHSQTEMMIQVDIERHTAVDWCQFLRDICMQWVENHVGPIGGTDAAGNPIEVQIDESKFMHRKYHRGRNRAGHWVFGGVEVGTNNRFLVPCPGNRRDAATLLPLIQRWILPGTRITSDMWAAYGGVANLPQAYLHDTVNHSRHFVDPQTGVHTQRIESMWSAVKRKFKRMCGTSDALFESYLNEFLWRKAHRENQFMNILYWIRIYY